MDSHTNQVIVLSGGEPIAIDRDFDLPEDAYVIAADSGLHHAATLGLAVDLVIGDMDSVNSDVLDDAIRNGSSIQRHPADKDHTDLELAFGAALDAGAEGRLSKNVRRPASGNLRGGRSGSPLLAEFAIVRR